MEVAYAILLMLLAVSLSDVGVRSLKLPLPLPLVQIGLGVALAKLGLTVKLAFNPQLFFLIFLAPLLFSEAARMPRRELHQLRGPILGMAVGLVLLTVLGVGALVHWLLPDISFAAACALGAVLAPTDAVALAALTGRLPMPRKLMIVLRGEALLNDASAVVALRVAVGVVATGQFSAGHAALSFVGLSVGGLLVGAVLGVLAGYLSNWLAGRHDDDPSGQAVLTLLVPFTCYLAGESVGASGILAAVAGGLAFNAIGLRSDRDVERRLRTRGIWHTLDFVLNGLIFVLLGLELPTRVGRLPAGMQLGYPLAIFAGLILTRLAWSWAMQSLARYRGPLLLRTLGGVRGTVTLAAVLTLPATFPSREAIIFLSTAVVLLSLGVGAVALPLLLRSVPASDDPTEQEEEKGRADSLKAGIEAVHRHADKMVEEGWNKETVQAAGHRLLEIYQANLREVEEEEKPDHESSHRAFQELRREGLHAQRATLRKLLEGHEINDVTRAKLQRELDLQEASLPD